MAPITDCVKQKKLMWTLTTAEGFIKQTITEAFFLIHHDFRKVFEVACDASSVGIKGILRQKGHPIAYFVRNLMMLN